MPDASDIADLIARCALKDRAAFSALYDRTSAKLFGVVLRVLKDRADAEDALQEIYVKIWHNAGKFAANNHSPMSWLIVLARNHAIDVIRSRKPNAVDIDDAIDVSDPSRSPEDEAVNASEGRRIDACLETLAENRAEAVRAAYVDGYSYEELAARFDVPLNTMRTWLRRSLIALKECLER